MKLLGTAIAVSACIYIAIMRIRSEHAKLCCLMTCIDALEQIRAEISLGYDDLPELFKKLSKAQVPENKFFELLSLSLCELGDKSFRELWTSVSAISFLPIGENSMNELCRVGNVLGRCDTQMQLSVLKHTIAYLEKELLKLREQLPQTKKLSLGLAAAAGLMTVILCV